MVRLFHPKESRTYLPIDNPDIKEYMSVIDEDAKIEKKFDALKKLYNKTIEIVFNQQLQPFKSMREQKRELTKQITVAKNIIESVDRSPNLRKEIKEARIILAAQILAASALGEVIENIENVVNWANET